MKSIVELCRELPGSEPEIRERAEEFNEQLRVTLGAEKVYKCIRDGHPNDEYAYCYQCGETVSEMVAPNYLNSIADAKAATDAIKADFFGIILNEVWNARFILPGGKMVDVIASTEELARSAAALLAAKAMGTAAKP